MKIFVMFGQRKESYDGEYAPEALPFIWDEFCIDENPDGYDKAVDEAKAQAEKDGFISTRLVSIEVDGEKIHRLLNKVPNLAGKIEAEGT